MYEYYTYFILFENVIYFYSRNLDGILALPRYKGNNYYSTHGTHRYILVLGDDRESELYKFIVYRIIYNNEERITSGNE